MILVQMHGKALVMLQVLADPTSAAETQMVDDDEVDAIDGQEVQAT